MALTFEIEFDDKNKQPKNFEEEINLRRINSMGLTTRTVSMLSVGSINLFETKQPNLKEQQNTIDLIHQNHSIKSIGNGCSNLKTSTKNKKPSFFKKRYIVLALCMMMNAFSHMLRTDFNFTIVKMVEDKTGNASSFCSSNFMSKKNTTSSNTINKYNNYFDWSEKMQGLVIGAYYWGYIVTNFNGGQMSSLIGAKILLFISLMVASLLTLTTPILAFQGPFLLMMNRILIGFAQGVTTPALYQLILCWMPRDDLGLVFALIMASGYVGTVVAMPLCALLSEFDIADGWPFVFYFFGTIGLIPLIPWWYYVFDSPDEHSTISDEEYIYIKANVIVSKSVPAKEKKCVPWSSIIKSKKIWAISIAKFCNNWSNLFLMCKLPTYLSNVLQVSLVDNSFINSSIHVSLGVSLLTWGRLSDFIEYRQYLSRTVSRKLFESFSLFGSALFLALIPVLGCDLISVIVLLNLSMITLGFSAGGNSLSIVDVAPDFSGSIHGLSNALANLPGVLAPYFVGFMLNDQPDKLLMQRWQVMFWFASIVNAFGGIVFLLFFDAKVEKWGCQTVAQLPNKKVFFNSVSKIKTQKSFK